MEVAMSLTPVTVVSSRKIRAAQIRPRNQARTAHVFHP
jgi:hypothetical protein